MVVNQNYGLSSLEIENFRQYRTTTIKFSQDPNRLFTIIKGANGAGKTNIMNAITWCLYGMEKHLDDDEKDLPIINTRALKESLGRQINMRVALLLADSDGDKFKIERKLTLYRIGAADSMTLDKYNGVTIPSGYTPETSQSFQWYDNGGGGWKTTDYFDKSVKEILPEDLATYFLFDGEKLEEFFDQEDNTKKGIEDVSQIGVVEDTIETLDKITKQKRKDVKDLEPQAKRYNDERIAMEEKLNAIKDQISKLTKTKASTKKRIDDIESDIKKAGGDVGELQEQANLLNDRIEQYQEQYDDAKSKLIEHALDQIPDILMQDAISQALEHMAVKTKKGILPPKIRDTFIQELLDRKECICGNDISDGKPRMKISNMLHDAQYSQISDICNELKYELSPHLSTDGMIEDLKKRQSGILSLKKKIVDHTNQLEECEAKIGRTGGESTKKLAEEKDCLREELDAKILKLGSLCNEEKGLKRDLDNVTDKYDRELRKSKKHIWLSRQLKFCNSALEGLEIVKNELLEDVREKVEQHTEEYFFKFLWKKDTYDGVSIGCDYRITAHHVDGYDARTVLAKGEKLVLALSFMAALRKITGFGFPLIIDTPFGRVSGEPRHNIAQFLPNFLENTQVTLLVTDSEYQAEIKDDDNQQKFPAIRDTIGRYVGQEYEIRFAEGKSDVVTKN